MKMVLCVIKCVIVIKNHNAKKTYTHVYDFDDNSWVGVIFR